MDEQVSSLSRRVQRLESFNRIHLVVSSLAVAAVVVVGQLPPIWADKDGPKSFSAGEFVLVDDAGRTTARLAAAPKGGAALTFYDPHGKRTVSFGFTDDANIAGTNLYDGNILAGGSGTWRGGVSINGPSATNPGFGWAVNQPNATRVLAGATRLDGTLPGIASYDSNGNLRTAEGISSSTVAGFFVADTNGKIRTGLDLDVSSVNFNGAFANDPNGTNRAFFGETADGATSLLGLEPANPSGAGGTLDVVTSDGTFSGDFVFDANGTARVVSSQDGTSASVTVSDASGNPVAHLP
jgi:hypothetical protein